MLRFRPLTQSVLSWFTLLLLCVTLVGSLGCEKQQDANKRAFAATQIDIEKDPKYGPIVIKLEYKREEILVYIQESPDTLPEDKTAAVGVVAQLMGDKLTADPDNKLKDLTFKGILGDEELWEVRFDFTDHKPHLEKDRLTNTM